MAQLVLAIAYKLNKYYYYCAVTTASSTLQLFIQVKIRSNQ
jgi:hypothetical protein